MRTNAIDEVLMIADEMTPVSTPLCDYANNILEFFSAKTPEYSNVDRLSLELGISMYCVLCFALPLLPLIICHTALPCSFKVSSLNLHNPLSKLQKC